MLVPVTNWLDAEEMEVWRAFIAVSLAVRAELDAELVAAHGLTEGDYAVLVNLSEAPERRMRMCDLSTVLHLSASGLTRRLDGLVKQGLVAREPATDDRRVTMAVLTDAGMAKLEGAAPMHVDGVRRHLVDRLTRPQLRQLGEALKAIQATCPSLAAQPS